MDSYPFWHDDGLDTASIHHNSLHPWASHSAMERKGMLLYMFVLFNALVGIYINLPLLRYQGRH